MRSIKKTEIKIRLNVFEDTWLCIYGSIADSIVVEEPEIAAQRGEAPWKLLEGCFYHYFFEKENLAYHKLQIKENAVVKNSLRKNVCEGRISPNIYVGSLGLEIYDKESDKNETVYIEVLPTKLDEFHNRDEDKDYRTNYEIMLGDIAEKCTELLLQIDSPAYQNFEADFNQDPRTIYQRFAFIKSMVNSEDFFVAVQKVISSPVSRWSSESEIINVMKVRKMTSKTIRQLSGPSNHYKLKSPIGTLESLPHKIEGFRKVETYDTHENRFIKFALQIFLQFIRECEDAFSKNNFKKSKDEASALGAMLENLLFNPFFPGISKPTVLKLNSPVLQRKSGYREILNVWIKFDLSLRLIWRGGDDVYKAGKRDIAILYEYWLFFKLYDLMVSKFKLSEIRHEDSNYEIKKYDNLIDVTKDGIHLIVKSGSFTALSCIYSSDGWNFNVRFSYNKTFSGKTAYLPKKEGSWTKPLRPDYTLSIWPEKLKDSEAEDQEQIVHLHFDSKYKVQHFTIPETNENHILDTEDVTDPQEIIDSLTLEKREELRGIYKNADLMKMHAYKDAIRRTSGAYILYPGTEHTEPLKGFHEIIPGLGAFAVKPQSTEHDNSDKGLNALAKFIDDVIANFKNSASQKKKYAIKTYETFKDKPLRVEDPLPYNLIPDETYVLVGFYKSEKHLQWIKNKKLYNFRMDNSKGALNLTNETLSSKYLFLHTFRDKLSNELWKIKGEGFRVTRKETLERLGYPSPGRDYYLVVRIEKVIASEFENLSWNSKNLKNYSTGRVSAFPFTTSLTELMKNKIR